MEHSDTVGGSGAAKFIHCPASYQLEQRIPRDDDAGSDYARLGNVLHDIMEWQLNELPTPNKRTQRAKAKAQLNFDKYEGRIYDGFVVTREMITNKLQPAMRAYHEITFEAGGWKEVAFEIEVDLSAYIPRAFGTLDVMGIGNDGRFYCVDWKFGDGVPVSPHENMQLAYYAFGAAYGSSRTDEADRRIRPIRAGIPEEGTFPIVFGIVQPRPDYADEADFETWDTDSDWLEKFGALLVSAWDKAQEADLQPVAGPHCRWCRAKLTCSAYKNPTAEALLLDTDSPNQMTAVELAYWLERAPQIQTFLNTLLSRAEIEMYERNVRIPGFKVVAARGRRKFTDEEEAEKRLVKLLGDDQAYAPRKIITPTQAEKLLGKTKYAEVADIVKMQSNSRKVVPQTDPGESLIENPAGGLMNTDQDKNADAVAALFKL